MSWNVSIHHRTAYVYAGEVRSSYNEARVTPLTTDRQMVLDAAVQVNPPTSTFRYWDYWGTIVDAFDVHIPHTELAVTGTSVVETSCARGAGRANWDDLGTSEVRDGMGELLAPTLYVPVIDEVADVARVLAASGSPTHACEAAGEWVRDRLSYRQGATDVATNAAEALQQRAGVCQDFAHLTLSLVRTMGIPARYTSGYVFPAPDAEVGATVEGQSHAWVEAWTGEWFSFDPTHGTLAGERHIVVARGRDYADVPPLKGIYHGGRAQALVVTVELTRLA